LKLFVLSLREGKSQSTLTSPYCVIAVHFSNEVYVEGIVKIVLHDLSGDDGTMAAATELADLSNTGLMRRRFSMTESFHSVHPVIYYLYTDEFFITPNDVPKMDVPVMFEHLPTYFLAKKLELIPLIDKIHKFFEISCHPRIISDRLFGPWGPMFPQELQAYFTAYMKMTWKSVSETKEYKDLCKNLRNRSVDAYMVLLNFLRENIFN
jgi:hypothetical protein